MFINANSSEITINTNSAGVTYIKFGYDDITLVNIEEIELNDKTINITNSPAYYI